MDDLSSFPLPTGGVIALGNFDGVHLGHRAVIDAARAKARLLGVPALAVTFEPHPTSFFRPQDPPFRLTPASARARLLLEAGADDVLALPFSAAMAALSAESFCEEILVRKLQARAVAVGFNFVFGAGRQGDPAFLRQTLEPQGIEVIEIPPCRDEGGDIISSSRIREALKEGNPELAATLLGRPFALEGEILHGDQRGRSLEMPTANMRLAAELLRPRFGVYAITAHRAGSPMVFGGVANIGVRPTIGDGKELLEFHLFDFSGSLYGEPWGIALQGFLRREEKFSDLSMLKEQIHKDAALARQLLLQKRVSLYK